MLDIIFTMYKRIVLLSWTCFPHAFSDSSAVNDLLCIFFVVYLIYTL